MFRRMTSRRALGSRALAVLAALMLAPACYEPEIPACLRCPTGECPSGQQCVQGRCARRGQSCAAATPEPCQDGRCCFGDACFSFTGETRPAVWLDWTSIRPFDAANEPLQGWLDRSGHGHDAFPDPVHSPFVGPGPLGGAARLVRMRRGTESVIVGQARGSPLFDMGRQDFLLLVAAALSCESTANQSYCLAQKHSLGRPDGTLPQGFFVRATDDTLRGVFMSGAMSPEAIAAEATGLSFTCEKFYVFGLRRIAAAPGQLQVRVAGNAVGSVSLPADADGTSSVPLLLGGLGACGGFQGRMAAVVAIAGAISDQQTCELERFLAMRSTEAGLGEVDTVLACPP